MLQNVKNPDVLRNFKQGKGGGKNFLLCSERLGKLFDEKSVEDGCFV